LLQRRLKLKSLCFCSLSRMDPLHLLLFYLRIYTLEDPIEVYDALEKFNHSSLDITLMDKAFSMLEVDEAEKILDVASEIETWEVKHFFYFS